MAGKARLDALAIWLMLLLCSLWGVQQVASKVALSEEMPPFMQAVLRSMIAGPLLVLWLFARRGWPGVRALVARDGSLWSGLIFGVEFMALFSGLRLTSASRGVVLLFTGVFFTVVGAHVFVPGERLRPVHVAGLGLAFLGVLATVGQRGGGGSVRGDALVLCAAAMWGATSVLVKAHPAMGRIGSEKVLAYQLFGALPVLALAALVAGEFRMPNASGLAWASLAYQGAVIAFASYLTWFWLIARYPAGRLSAFTFLSPPFGILAAWGLLHEVPTALLGVGVLLICAGLWLVNR